MVRPVDPKIIAQTFKQLDRRGIGERSPFEAKDGKITIDDRTLKEKAILAMDKDGDKAIDVTEFEEAANSVKTRKGQRQLRRAERVSNKLAKAETKLAKKQAVLAEEREVLQNNKQQVAVMAEWGFTEAAVQGAITNGIYETISDFKEMGRELSEHVVKSRREKIARVWNKVAKQTPAYLELKKPKKP